MRHEALIGLLLISNMLMATRLTLTFSLSRYSRSRIHPLLKRTSCSFFNPKHSHKSLPCPLWSSSFSFCIDSLHKSTSPSFTCSASSMAASALDVEANPLLKEFVFPPFDVVEAKHVRPGIRALLEKLVRRLKLLDRLLGFD